MKLSYREIESFVKSPAPTARVILVYGPDGGLVSERANIIGKTISADLSDPFNVATLTADALSDDPALLGDEAYAISMMGGNRLIRIKDGADKLTTLLKSYLEKPSETNLVVVTAGELGPKSSLRKLCESAKNAAAVPCYVEDARDLSRLIRETLHEAHLRADNDAVTWLTENISGDRGKVRAELEKLITYKGNETSPVSLSDAQAACGAAGAQNFDDLVYNVAGHNPAKAMAAYHTLTDEGTTFIAIIRSLQTHFRKLHLVSSCMQNGMDADMAMKKLSPPVFFKQVPMFKTQIRNWSLPTLNTVLKKLSDLEAQCKQTAMPADTLCAQAILAISASKPR